MEGSLFAPAIVLLHSRTLHLHLHKLLLSLSCSLFLSLPFILIILHTQTHTYSLSLSFHPLSPFFPSMLYSDPAQPPTFSQFHAAYCRIFCESCLPWPRCLLAPMDPKRPTDHNHTYTHTHIHTHGLNVQKLTQRRKEEQLSSTSTDTRRAQYLHALPAPLSSRIFVCVALS